jgi:hypothetical protein
MNIFLVDLLNCLKSDKNNYETLPELTEALIQVATKLRTHITALNTNFRLYVVTKLLNITTAFSLPNSIEPRGDSIPTGDKLLPGSTNSTKTDSIKLVSWAFAKVFSDYPNQWEVVLVHASSASDKDADDRALFKLKQYFEELVPETSIVVQNSDNSLQDPKIVIISNDKFRDLASHYHLNVKCSFFWISTSDKKLPSDWEACDLIHLSAKTMDL